MLQSNKMLKLLLLYRRAHLLVIIYITKSQFILKTFHCFVFFLYENKLEQFFVLKPLIRADFSKVIYPNSLQVCCYQLYIGRLNYLDSLIPTLKRLENYKTLSSKPFKESMIDVVKAINWLLQPPLIKYDIQL